MLKYTQPTAALKGTLALLLASLPASAHAQETFESLAGFHLVPIASPFGGYTYTNFFSVDGCSLDSQIGSPSFGYCAGVTSGVVDVFNGYGEDASISHATPFTFGGAWFSAAFTADPALSDDIRPNAATAVLVEGYSGATLLYSTLFDITFKVPKFLVANWAGIDRLAFSSHLTSDNPGGNQFVMDDIYLEQVPSTGVVPEPATLTLISTGLAGVALGRRRSRAQPR